MHQCLSTEIIQMSFREIGFYICIFSIFDFECENVKEATLFFIRQN